MCKRAYIIIINIAGQIDPEASLFTYSPGLSALNYSFPNHEPAFLDEVVAGASQEVLDACGDNVLCIFDASQTGNTEIGMQTTTIEETNVANEETASKCMEISLSINRHSRFMIRICVCASQKRA